MKINTKEANVIKAAMAMWQAVQQETEFDASVLADACEALYLSRRADCRACAIEKEIGTDEVPHPVDSRLHACLESAE